MRRIFTPVVVAISLLSVAALGASLTLVGGGARAAHAAPDGQGPGLAPVKFASFGSASNFSADAKTIPYWQSQFTDPTSGVTYPFTMVGANPASNSSVTVPTEIIPIRLTFDRTFVPGLTTLDGATQVANIVNSPVFDASADIGAAASQSAGAPPPEAAGRTVHEPSDVTQVGDAMLRAQWGKTGTGYHVLLGQPTVLPTQTIDVPQQQGFIAADSYYSLPYGAVDSQWFYTRASNVLTSLQIDPHTLPIIVTDDVVLGTIVSGQIVRSDGYLLAYHAAAKTNGAGNDLGSANGNGKQQVLTSIYFSYYQVAIWPPFDGDSVNYLQDVYGLTHEVQEWMDDPFGTNVVTPYLSPDLRYDSGATYGCSNLLEPGDPLVWYGFTVTLHGKDYHPTDVADLSWFARQSPSIADGGYYTYLNNYPTPPQSC